MASRKLYVFEHDTRLGNAPAHKLFECVKIVRKKPAAPPRQFGDYEVIVDSQSMPPGVHLIEKL